VSFYRTSLFASLYYRSVAAASAVLRGRRGSALLVRILGVARKLQSALGSNATNALIDGHLRRIFPEHGEEWRSKVIRGYWRRHQSVMVALFNNRRISPHQLSEYVDFHGLHYLERSLDAGDGVLLLAPHYGDARTLHILLGMAGYPVSVISSRYVDSPEFVRRSRLAAGQRWNHIGFPDQSPRWMFETLQRGEVLHIAPTGYGGPRGSWTINFEVPVLASSSPYRMQKRTGAKMLIGHNRILPGMRYRLELSPFEPEPDGSDFTQRLFDRFEERAREHPDQYDWMHLIIRHRESNTIARIGYIPRDERELERLAIPEDSDPEIVRDPIAVLKSED